jgi:hypothetical protein
MLPTRLERVEVRGVEQPDVGGVAREPDLDYLTSGSTSEVPSLKLHWHELLFFVLDLTRLLFAASPTVLIERVATLRQVAASA